MPPGCTVRFRPGDDDVAVTPYWTGLPDGAPLALGPDVLADVRDGVRAAVRRRMVADVPLGALLSGGVDSSLIVALMTEAAAEPVRTFSVGFPEQPAFDERSHARAVADTLGRSTRS